MAHILVIDDNRPYRRLIAHILAAAGHTVHEAGDGAAGLAACRESPPDLVITDIVMPEMEGIETIRELARMVPHMPIVAISGGCAPELYLRAAKTLGAAAVLPKPFGADDLLSTVSEVIGRAGASA